MVFRPLGLQTQSLDPQPSVGTDTGKVEESLRLQVYRSVWGFQCDQTLKNPVTAGENELEPVVGIEPTTYGLRSQSSIRANSGFDLNLLQVKWGFSSGGVGEPLGDQSTKCYR